MKFDREGDVRQTLRHSYMMYDGKPVFIRQECVFDGELGVECEDLTTGTVFATRTDAPELDHIPPKLGYVNLSGEAVYLRRDPARQWKRGLTTNTVQPAGILSHDVVLRLYTKKYPTFDFAIKAVESGLSSSVAFSRHFAVNGKGILYRGLLVSDSSYQLLSKFSHLSSRLWKEMKQ